MKTVRIPTVIKIPILLRSTRPANQDHINVHHSNLKGYVEARKGGKNGGFICPDYQERFRSAWMHGISSVKWPTEEAFPTAIPAILLERAFVLLRT
ncbi:MAG: hypothetical protein WBB32_03075 [Flavobacteriales bacterium]|nr:hypothetical protein [Flavobacteriales bacterium]